ncbi:hypothetical protein [Aquipseudomonas campi]
MINRYVIAAAVLILLVLFSYVLQFYVNLGFSVSADPEVWGQLGDYVGGMLNPLLSFISIVLLIKSLTLQREANLGLRAEIRNTRKTERLRSFETQIFNMINSQQSYFDNFKIDFVVDGEKARSLGAEAVIRLEEIIESMREEGGDLKAVSEYIECVDYTDHIYSLTRIFYNMVKAVDDRLSDSKGFTEEDRRSYYLTLINFTDFSLLRLVVIAAQFMDYPSTEYLKANVGFNSVLEEVGLGYDLY